LRGKGKKRCRFVDRANKETVSLHIMAGHNENQWRDQGKERSCVLHTKLSREEREDVLITRRCEMRPLINRRRRGRRNGDCSIKASGPVALEQKSLKTCPKGRGGKNRTGALSLELGGERIVSMGIRAGL